MNLPYSVLGYIPWFNTYQSSKMGPEPQPDGGFNLILWLLSMTNPVLNNAIALLVSMTGIEIFAYLKEYCENVFMNVLTAIGDLVWTLIRAAVLIFIWVLFAIILFIVLALYIVLVSVSLMLSLFLNIEVNINSNSIEIYGDLDFSFSFSTNFEYIELFQIYVPSMSIFFELLDFEFEYYSAFSREKIQCIEFPNDFISEMTSTCTTASTLDDLHASENEEADLTSLINVLDFITGIGVAWGIAGGFVSLVAAYKIFEKRRDLVTNFEIITQVVYIITLIVFLITLIVDSNYWSVLGIGIGFITAGIAFIMTAAFVANIFQYMDRFSKILSGKEIYELMDKFDEIFAFIGLSLDLEAFFGLLETSLGELNYKIIQASLAMFTGSISLLLAIGILIMTFGKHPTKSYSICNIYKSDKIDISLTFGLISIIIGLVFIACANIFLIDE